MLVGHINKSLSTIKVLWMRCDIVVVLRVVCYFNDYYL